MFVPLDLSRTAMRITVRLFAILRDCADGTDTFDLELANGASVAEALAMLGKRLPRLWSYLPQTKAAVNREFASREDLLADGDELALIPPVSGG